MVSPYRRDESGPTPRRELARARLGLWFASSPIPAILCVLVVVFAVRGCAVSQCAEACTVAGDQSYWNGFMCKCITPSGERYRP